jgi:hypothetical protein
MKNIIAALLIAATVSGCSTVKSWIPSFWDDNQSASIVTVRLKVDRFNCAGDQLAQISEIRDQLRWFELYSESKGWRQQDVQRITEPMRATVEDFYQRTVKQPGSTAYCQGKKMIMQQQSKRAAEAILGRF